MDGPEGLLVPLLSPFPHQLAELHFDRECCSHREPYQPYQQMVVYWFHQRTWKISYSPVDPCNEYWHYLFTAFEVASSAPWHRPWTSSGTLLCSSCGFSDLSAADCLSLGNRYEAGRGSQHKLFRIYLTPWILSSNSNTPVWTSETQYQKQILAPSSTLALSMQWEHQCSTPPMASFSVARTMWKTKGCNRFSRCC